ncbi:11175_t:CDS:2, partial [Acaulospora colombiana]
DEQKPNGGSEDIYPLKPEKSLPVNSLNFCKFGSVCGVGEREEILVAIPSVTESSAIDIWNLSNQRLITSSIGLDQKRERGYCMALKFFRNLNSQDSLSTNYLILAAYENGSVVLWSVKIGKNDSPLGDDEEIVITNQLWSRKEHIESALGLDVSVDKKFAISTAGDNKIVKYIFDDENYRAEPLIKSTTIKHSGIADVKIRSDGKIFATAGWDTKIRIFSSNSLKPLAILSYHRESVYALAFSKVFEQEDEISKSKSKDKEADDGTVQEQLQQFTNHCLIGGGKDHRISLWEIY